MLIKKYEVKGLILEFLKWPKEKQLEYFKDDHLADISVFFYKATVNRRNNQVANRKKKAQDPIHSNFEELMKIFNINIETGEVWRWGTMHPNQKLVPNIDKNTNYSNMVFKGRTYTVHQLVMMKYLGRFIKSGYEVNHKNLNHQDNRIANLEEMPSSKNKEHYQKLRKSLVS